VLADGEERPVDLAELAVTDFDALRKSQSTRYIVGLISWSFMRTLMVLLTVIAIIWLSYIVLYKQRLST
jgi:hypothetical protein